MSELKAIRSGEIYNIIEYEDCYRTDDLYYPKSESDKAIARHKYKRCLAMAEMCEARYDEEDAKENWCGLSWEYISKEMKYWERWRWRWDALAEKFKEDI